MWILIRRELSLMSHYWDLDRTHGRFVSGIIRYWLVYSLLIFPPSFLIEKWLETPLETTVATIVLVFTLVTVYNDLLADDEQRQTLFLQTLPIRKSQLVHAKMASVLLLWILNFVLFLLPTALIQVYRSTTEELWSQLGMFMSLALFVSSVHVLGYFLWGLRRRGRLIFFLAIIFWLVLTSSGGYLLVANGMAAQGLLFILPLLLSVFAFVVCWWIAVKSMNKRGFAYDRNRSSSARLLPKEDRA